ncbi:hypothetical protein, partial [Escherichia coli]|uniref:hypothetical protein n=1 Tax=Escherichia coli TaxID=562 RepID=UPI001A8C8E63
FAAPHHIDPARSVGFSTKQRRTPAVAAARMDWVMSPSSGDALLCFAKKDGTSRKQVYKLVPPKQWLLWWGCHLGVWST